MPERFDVGLDFGHAAGQNRSPVVPEYSEGTQMYRLGQHLIKALEDLGRTVKVTKRNPADNPSVTERGRMMAGCRVGVSLHSDAGGNGKTDRATGLCFVDDDCGAIDSQSEELARRLAQSATEVMGLKNAPKVVARRSGLDRDGDGALNDDYYGYLYAGHQKSVACCIIENGFHDHAATARWLLKDDNLRKLAKSHAAVIDAFLREHFDKEETDMFKIDKMLPGDKGEPIRQMQGVLLIAGYYDGALDGSYGPKTTKAVQDFQTANGLEPDGKAGPKTLQVLRSFAFEVAKQDPQFHIVQTIQLQGQRYNAIEELPDWAQEPARELVELGVIKGDEDGKLDLSLDMVRTLMMVLRLTGSREIIDKVAGQLPGDVLLPVEPPEPNIGI